MDMFKYFAMEENYASFRPSGQVSLERAIQLVRDAISTARERGVKKLLINIAELEGFEPPTISARYFFVREWAEASRGIVCIAIVARQELIDPQKFGVTAAANAGLAGNVFTSEQVALQWLLNYR